MNLYFKLLALFVVFSSTNSFDSQDPYKLSKIEILDYTQVKLAKYKWFKIKKEVCNDEYDEWLCCDFYYSKNEKIHVVYSDKSGLYPHYIETNLNIFQGKRHFKINDFLKDILLDGKYSKLILNDEGLAEVEEFDTLNKNKYLYLYKLSCSEELSSKINKIESQLKLKTNRILPKNLKTCKIISCKIIKNFDYKNRLFEKP